MATSVAVIADAAGVSPETVYATYGSKRNLLEAVVTEAATGDADGRGVLDADVVRGAARRARSAPSLRAHE